MIKLPDNIAPPKNVLDKLKKYQDDIDKLDSFTKKSDKAKSSFKSKNTKKNKTFESVKVSLTKMCSGARRCVYCEDSVGDEVEHIRPKDLYPELCFVWENYVYACGNCNGPKSNKFAVFRDADGEFHDTSSEKGVQPPKGTDVMINPRIENPMDYCMLDLRGTFKFVIIKPNGTKDHKKADYTFNEILRLNDQREFLREARKTAFGNYKARLYYYTKEKKHGASQSKLDAMIEQIKVEAHPTVWKEMQRYFSKGFLQTFDAELHQLFIESPEALTW